MNGVAVTKVTKYTYYRKQTGEEVIKTRYDYADGSKSFAWPPGTRTSDVGLYNQQELADVFGEEDKVLVVEGEKTADALLVRGIVAVSLAGGSGQRDLSALDILSSVPDSTIYLSPDNDAVGLKAATAWYEHLKRIHPKIKWVPPVIERPGGDFADLLSDFSTDADADARRTVFSRLDAALDAPPGLTPVEVAPKRGEDFVDLIAEADEPVVEFVPGLFNEGTYILAGAPKLGKSWLTLSVAQGLAMGGAVLGRVQVEPADVLYLCLEDGRRRFKRRAKMRSEGLEPPERGRFEVHFTWPKLDEGGSDRLEAWLALRAAASRRACVVIDTGIRLRPGADERKGDMYRQDYEYLATITDIVQRHNALCIVVSHTRKAEALDFIDMVIGSHGITGAVEGVMVFMRERHSKRATLLGTDKDGEEIKLVLEWNEINGGWNITDNPDEATEQKRRVMLLIERAKGLIASMGHPMTLQELRLGLAIQRNTLVEALGLAVQWGMLTVTGAGKRGDPERYDLPSGIDTGIDTD